MGINWLRWDQKNPEGLELQAWLDLRSTLSTGCVHKGTPFWLPLSSDPRWTEHTFLPVTVAQVPRLTVRDSDWVTSFSLEMGMDSTLPKPQALKKSQHESWAFSFTWGKIRTWTLETASQVALRSFSEEVKGVGGAMIYRQVAGTKKF